MNLEVITETEIKEFTDKVEDFLNGGNKIINTQFATACDEEGIVNYTAFIQYQEKRS